LTIAFLMGAPVARAEVPRVGAEIALGTPSYGRVVSDLEYDVLAGHRLATRQAIGDAQSQLALWGTSASLHVSVRNGDGSQAGPAVGTLGAGIGRAAFDGARFLIAWTDVGGKLWASVLGRDGARVFPDRLLADAASVEDVVFDGTHYLVIARTSELVSVRLDRDGAPVAPGPTALAGTTGFGRARAAAGDGVVMVVMLDGSEKPSVWATRVALEGTALDPAPVRLSVPRPSHASSAPSVAFGEGRFLAVWADEAPVLIDIAYPFDTARRLEGAWMSAPTPPGAGAWFAITEDATGMGLGHVYALEHDGGSFAVVTNRGYVVKLIRDGTTLVTPAKLVPGQVSFRLDPALAKERMRLASHVTVVATGYDGNSYLVVFKDDQGLGAVRLAPDGKVLDTPPLRLTTVTATEDFRPQPERVGVHVGAGQFRVTWSILASWYGNRVTTAGQVRDGNGFEIGKTTSLRDLNVVFMDGELWVATCHGTFDGLLPLEATGDYSQPPGSHACSSICGPASCLVFEERTHLWTPTRDVVLGDLCTGCGGTPVGAVGANGYAVLVREDQIALALLAADGVPVAVTPLLDRSVGSAYAVAYPRIVFDGTRYVVVWQRQNEIAGAYDLLAAWVDETGAVLAGPQLITPRPGMIYGAPVAAAGPNGQVLVAYSRTGDDPAADGALQPYVFLLDGVGAGPAGDGGAMDADGVDAGAEGLDAGVDAAAAGVHGAVTPDLPLDRSDRDVPETQGGGCSCTVGATVTRSRATVAIALGLGVFGLALRRARRSRA
jgi:hypothetical protein